MLVDTILVRWSEKDEFGCSHSSQTTLFEKPNCAYHKGVGNVQQRIVLEPQLLHTTNASCKEKAFSQCPKRILVVEDNPDNRILITDVLTSLDYEVLVAVDGEEGVAKAEAELPDLILMDLSLPHMDGWTATKHIKSNADLGHIPVIALTAHAMVGDRERALEAGCDDYVSKPIDLKELSIKLAKFLD